MPDAVAATNLAQALPALASGTSTTTATASLDQLTARGAERFAQSLWALATSGPQATVSLGAMVGASTASSATAGLTGASALSSATAGLTGASALSSATAGLRGLAAMGVGQLAGVGAATAAGSAAPMPVPMTADDRRAAAVTNFALDQLGKPYVFGTSGPNTFDCSGLVSAAYKQAGVDMPAYTFTQATYGRPIDPKTEAIRPGDLIFVRGGRPAQDLGHVGMAISATEWVQAPHTGDVVKVGPLPYDRIQVVRRIIG